MTTLNHRVFNTRNYITAAIIAGFIFLAFVIFRGCDNSPSYKEDVKKVATSQDTLKKVEDRLRVDSIRLTQHNDSLQAALLDLKNKKDVIDKELTITKTKVQKLATQNEQAKTARDTARYIETCDSLKDLARLQGEIITMYQENDSIRTANYEDQITAKDRLLANRAELISQLRTTNTETYETLMQINTDYNKVTRKLKRERTLSRILAAGAAVLGGVSLLK